MKKPNKYLLSLYELGVINRIAVDYKLETADEAETYVTLYNDGKKVKGKWSTYREYLDVAVGYNSVAQLKAEYKQECIDWEKFQIENKEDYDKYLELKKRFEGEQIEF